MKHIPEWQCSTFPEEAASVGREEEQTEGLSLDICVLGSFARCQHEELRNASVHALLQQRSPRIQGVQTGGTFPSQGLLKISTPGSTHWVPHQEQLFQVSEAWPSPSWTLAIAHHCTRWTDSESSTKSSAWGKTLCSKFFWKYLQEMRVKTGLTAKPQYKSTLDSVSKDRHTYTYHILHCILARTAGPCM